VRAVRALKTAKEFYRLAKKYGQHPYEANAQTKYAKQTIKEARQQAKEHESPGKESVKTEM
jgi:hypothetical protein